MFSSTHKIRKQLSALITRAEQFGLLAADVTASQEFLRYNEYGLCLDQIVTQLYEYEIHVDKEFYSGVEDIAKQLSLPEDTYNYISALLV